MLELQDVAGLDVVKKQFDEIVEFLKDPKKFTDLGVRPPKGVLLDGPPGCGKTLLAKAIAGEADVGFYQMSGAEFVEGIVGVGAARMRDLFARARAYNDPILIFIDEIDALALRRAGVGEKANEEREQVRCPPSAARWPAVCHDRLDHDNPTQTRYSGQHTLKTSARAADAQPAADRDRRL